MRNFKAYIASNDMTKAFDVTRFFNNPKSALKSIKARNAHDWKWCVCWVVEVYEDGQERKIDEKEY